jgi:hypothetical protein
MLRFAADENFNADIVRGLRRRLPELDIVRVQDVVCLALMIRPSSNGPQVRAGSC